MDRCVSSERPVTNAALRDFGSPHLAVDDPEEILQIGLPPNRIDLLRVVPGPEFGQAWQRRIRGKYGRADVNWIDLTASSKSSRTSMTRAIAAMSVTSKRFGHERAAVRPPPGAAGRHPVPDDGRAVETLARRTPCGARLQPCFMFRQFPPRELGRRSLPLTHALRLDAPLDRHRTIAAVPKSSRCCRPAGTSRVSSSRGIRRRSAWRLPQLAIRDAANTRTLPTSTATITAHNSRPTASSLMFAISAGADPNCMPAARGVPDGGGAGAGGRDGAHSRGTRRTYARMRTAARYRTARQSRSPGSVLRSASARRSCSPVRIQP